MESDKCPQVVSLKSVFAEDYMLENGKKNSRGVESDSSELTRPYHSTQLISAGG